VILKKIKIRHLVIVLGDQLDQDSTALADFDPKQDAVWMAEVAYESTKVWTSKPRIAIFLSAMRHFREKLTERGWRVFYRELGPKKALWQGLKTDGPEEKLGSQLLASLSQLTVEKVIMVRAGEWSVQEEITQAVAQADWPLEVRPDQHFLCSPEDFAAHAAGRKQLRLEFFYREMRQRTDVLMEGETPVGGAWNFDEENRESFGKNGPGQVIAPRAYAPDSITQEVIAMINQRFADHPGSLEKFDWPVTSEEAETALEDFIRQRLPDFGRYQDAMWTHEPWLYHSRLSAAMNVKLLHPRRVIDAAEQAYRKKQAPLAAVEGFIRQILGWREYVRGVYWLHMPGYVERNQMKATHDLPSFYWTGKTEMRCLGDALGQTLQLGYAHHIQRLMVTGLYALLYGVHPRQVHEWYLAVYVDAVEWVELPNTLGMSQYADGGVMASKPYIASGKYIQRMSNYCQGCRYDPSQRTGEKACPFTTLYWSYLITHEETLKKNPRMGMQVRNVTRLTPAEKKEIQTRAQQLRKTQSAATVPA
jgi:deoxyribodipyrimidine photolyase-related protein